VDRKDADGHDGYSEAKIGDREQQGQYPGPLMRGDWTPGVSAVTVEGVAGAVQGDKPAAAVTGLVRVSS
jgi:hypothetical protein